MRTKRGFSILEVTLGATIFIAVSGAVMGLAATGQGLYANSQHHQAAAGRAHALMERIFAELRHASINGEDRPGIDNLDVEDTNDNGRLDADFSLASGESDSGIVFNISRGQGLVSDRMEIRFVDNKVWHIAGSTNPRRSVLARDVRALTFTRQGKRIIVNIITNSGVAGDANSPGSARSGKRVSLVREVLLRN